MVGSILDDALDEVTLSKWGMVLKRVLPVPNCIPVVSWVRNNHLRSWYRSIL